MRAGAVAIEARILCFFWRPGGLLWAPLRFGFFGDKRGIAKKNYPVVSLAQDMPCIESESLH
jgi:hypothetical protein